MKNEVNRALVAKKKFYLLTIIFALLGINQVWGNDAYTCTVYENADGNQITTNDKDQLVLEVKFDNLDGVDSLEFVYNCGKGLTVYYSTDGGANYSSLGDKGDYEGDRLVGNFLTGNQRNANAFKFTTRKKGSWSWGSYVNYTCLVKAVKVFKSPKVELNTTSYAFAQTAVGSNLHQDFVVSTYNLSENLSVVKSGANAEYFSYELSAASGSCPTTYTMTITYAPLAETTGEDTHVAAFEVSANGSTATLNVSGTASSLVAPTYTWTGLDTYLVDDEALDLNSIWKSSNLAAEKHFSIKSWTAKEGVPTEGANAPAINEGMLSLGQAGTLVLKVSQDASTGYTDGSAEKTIEINRRTPVFTWYSDPVYCNAVIANFWTSSNNDIDVEESTSDPTVATIANAVLTTYYKEDNVSISVHQDENYKWLEANDHKDITVGTQVNHLKLTYTKAMFENSNITVNKYSKLGMLWDETNDCICLGNGETSVFNAASSESDDKYVDIKFEGIPASVSFQIATNQNADTGEYYYVKESKNGTDWSGELWHSDQDGTAFKPYQVDLNQESRYIRICYSGNFSGFYKNLVIEELKQFETYVGEDIIEGLDFGDIEINSEVAEKTLTFKHANAGYNVSVKLEEEGETKFFAIDHTTVDNTGGEKCGEENFKVTFNPSAAGLHTATVTFSDQLGNEKVVTLSARVKITPTVTAPEAKELTYSGAEQELVIAGETDGGTLQYCLGEGEWGTSIPKATNAGDYVVKYRVVGDDTYFDVAEASVNVTIAKATPVIDPAPLAGDIEVGQTLSNSELYNGSASVPGTFAWADDTIEPDSTGTKKYNVIFTPNDTENYNTVIIEVEVRVTDQETAVFNTESGLKATKILRDGQVFILRDGKVYNLNGQEVR